MTLRGVSSWSGTNITGSFPAPRARRRGLGIDPAAGDEEEIGEAVDIGERAVADMLALVGLEFNDQAFGAAADGAGEMEMGRRHVAAGQHEGAQGGEV